MKLNKLNRILSYTPHLLVVYSLFCLCLNNNDWYYNNWAVIDKYDLAFYIFAYCHLGWHYKKYPYFSKNLLFCIFLYLGFKIIDSYVIFRYNDFIFWNIFILVILPIVFWINKNRNR